MLESTLQYDDQALKSGRWTPPGAFPLKVSKGKKWYDLVPIQDPFNFAISRRFLDVLKKTGLTGWKTYPIAIEGQTQDYHGFLISGKAGPLKRPKAAGFLTGYEFEIDSWDGSDLFTPAGTFSLFCTENARQVLLESKLTNIELENIRDAEWYSV